MFVNCAAGTDAVPARSIGSETIIAQVSGSIHAAGVTMSQGDVRVEERDLASSYSLGANSFIQKPVDFDQFRATVKAVGMYWMVTNQPPVVTRASKTAAAG